VLTHRLSYQLYKGEIPKNKEIMHSCHNRLCINPDHLSYGTRKQNMQDASINKSWANVKRIGASGINKNQSIQVLVLGGYFGSIKEAERNLGLGAGTVRYWINNAPFKAKIISKSEYLENKHG